MAALSAQTITTTGLAATANAADAAGDTIPFGSHIRINNGSAGAITLTVVTPGVVDDDLAIADRDISIPAGAARYVRPSRDYRDAETNLVSLTYSAVASVTVEVLI